MTTIAYSGGTMACDSCWSLDGMVDTLATKVHRFHSGVLFGSAGNADDRALVEMIMKVTNPSLLPSVEELSEIKTEGMALVVFPSGRVFKVATNKEVDSVGVWEISERVAAIGSGAQAARIAMHCGKSAREAVEICCVFDMNSRGPVHSIELKK